MTEQEYLELIEQQAEQLRRCAQALTLAGHVLLYNFNQRQCAEELYDIALEALTLVGEDVVTNEYRLMKNASCEALGMGQPGDQLAGETTVG